MSRTIYTINGKTFPALPKKAPKNLMICGSRDASPRMLSFARYCTLKVLAMDKMNVHVLVGDAHGIDEEVVRTCMTWGIPFTCCGIAQNPRNGATRQHYQRIISTTNTYADKYRERDQFLVGQADFVICISNGEERRANGQLTGTLTVHEYAKSLGKQVHLRTFRETEVLTPTFS